MNVPIGAITATKPSSIEIELSKSGMVDKSAPKTNRLQKMTALTAVMVICVGLLLFFRYSMAVVLHRGCDNFRIYTSVREASFVVQ